MDKRENIGHKIRLLHNQLHKRMEYNKEKNVYDTDELTRMQQFTIGFIDHNSDREIYQKDIEAEFAISRATASNILSVMERKDLIRREPVEHDARLKKVVLTEKAKMRQQQVEQDIRETEELLTQGLTEGDKQRLQRYLDIMIQNMVDARGECTTISCKKEQK